MGLLDHLWDDTVAGPPPETGLGKLRKNNTLNFRSDFCKENSRKTEAVDDTMRVTRSIMIVKRPQVNIDSPPASPASPSPPVSPFSDGGRPYRFRRRSASFVHEKGVGSRSSPPPYDV